MRSATWHGFVVLALAGGSLLACGDDSKSNPDAGGGNPDAPVGGNPDAPVGGNPDAPVGGDPDGQVPAGGLAVFADDYGADVAFAPFIGSTVVAVDTAEHHVGAASLRLEVPATEYAGGSLRTAAPVDLSTYNALSFWAKASKAATLNVVGFGNAGANAHQVEWGGVALTTAWTQFVIPVPASSALTAESGLFHFAEGSDEGAYQIWFDDVRFVTVDAATFGTPRPAIATSAATKQVGETLDIAGASVAYTIDTVDRVLAVGRSYFTYASSNTAVATVDGAGKVTAVAEGTAEITATLGATPAVGALALTVTAVTVPTEPAPTPTVAAADVIALYSDAYTAVPVDTFRTPWSEADQTETMIGTDHVQRYSNVNYVGIEFFATAGRALDATTMTHFHVDVWLPALTTLGVKLVDFGADGVFGGDDSEFTIPLNGTSTPPLTAGQWVSIDLPLASFTGLLARNHLAQLIFTTTARDTVYVDNVYFHRITPAM
jgi:hypothetical protein